MVFTRLVVCVRMCNRETKSERESVCLHKYGLSFRVVSWCSALTHNSPCAAPLWALWHFRSLLLCDLLAVAKAVIVVHTCMHPLSHTHTYTHACIRTHFNSEIHVGFLFYFFFVLSPARSPLVSLPSPPPHPPFMLLLFFFHLTPRLDASPLALHN